MEEKTFSVCSHFEDQFRARIENCRNYTSNEIKNDVLDAIDFGLKLPDIKNNKFRQHLINTQKAHKYICDFRVWRGFVYVFDAFELVAITIYPIPEYACSDAMHGY